MQSYTLRLKTQSATLQLARGALQEIGAVLREGREKRSLGVKDIREKTCIPVHHILAIENGIREQLPEDLFLVGFIKRYARIVGLNEQALCEKYLNRKVIKDVNNNDDPNDFHLLFQEKNEQKVIRLRPDKRNQSAEELESDFLKVYHFYFLVGVLLFAAACYLMFHFTKHNQEESKVKYETFSGVNFEAPLPLMQEENQIAMPVVENKRILITKQNTPKAKSISNTTLVRNAPVKKAEEKPKVLKAVTSTQATQVQKEAQDNTVIKLRPLRVEAQPLRGSKTANN